MRLGFTCYMYISTGRHQNVNYNNVYYFMHVTTKYELMLKTEIMLVFVVSIIFLIC